MGGGAENRNMAKNINEHCITQETTAPQTVSFHRTPQREKQTSNILRFEITAN